MTAGAGFGGHKNAGIIAAEIYMLRATGPGAVLLVEGADDQRFWTPFLDRSCRLVSCEGKPNVLSVLAVLRSRGIVGVLAIVDADLDPLEDGMTPSNLLLTPERDLECMLLRSRALGHVLTEYVPLSLLRDIDEMAGAVRGQLIGLALPLGRLRWAARRQGWQLSVDHLRLHEDVLARPSMTLDEEALHRHAAGRVALPVEDVVAAVAALPEADPWHVIQGHDAVGLLVGLLKGRYGVTGTFGSTQLASALRAAFREDDLRASPLLAWVVAWEEQNAPLVVLSVRPR